MVRKQTLASSDPDTLFTYRNVETDGGLCMQRLVVYSDRKRWEEARRRAERRAKWQAIYRAAAAGLG